jgi:hypothetical protein
VPDYLVLARFDVIANASDAVIVCSLCAAALAMAADVAASGRRGASSA